MMIGHSRRLFYRPDCPYGRANTRAAEMHPRSAHLKTRCKKTCRSRWRRSLLVLDVDTTLCCVLYEISIRHRTTLSVCCSNRLRTDLSEIPRLSRLLLLLLMMMTALGCARHRRTAVALTPESGSDDRRIRWLCSETVAEEARRHLGSARHHFHTASTYSVALNAGLMGNTSRRALFKTHINRFTWYAVSLRVARG